MVIRTMPVTRQKIPRLALRHFGPLYFVDIGARSGYWKGDSTAYPYVWSRDAVGGQFSLAIDGYIERMQLEYGWIGW